MSNELARKIIEGQERIADLLEDVLYELRQQAFGDHRIWELSELADRLGISERTLRRRIHDSRTDLESRHEGGKQVVPHKSAVRYLASMPKEPLKRKGGRPKKS